MSGSFPSPNKAWKARAAAHLRFTKSSRKKRRSGSGAVCNFLRGAPELLYLRGAGGCLARTSQIKPAHCPRTQYEGGAMQNSSCKSMVQHFSNSIINKQATRRIWSLYTYEGFLLYTVPFIDTHICVPGLFWHP